MELQSLSSSFSQLQIPVYSSHNDSKGILAYGPPENIEDWLTVFIFRTDRAVLAPGRLRQREKTNWSKIVPVVFSLFSASRNGIIQHVLKPHEYFFWRAFFIQTPPLQVLLEINLLHFYKLCQLAKLKPLTSLNEFSFLHFNMKRTEEN